jgi:ribosomal protein L30/L7E
MAKSKTNPRQLHVKLVKSTNGRIASHKACVSGLGLRA